MIRFACIFCVAFIVALLFIVLYCKYNSESSQKIALRVSRQVSVKWVILISCELIALYAILAFSISTAWLKGDDYIFFHYPEISLIEKLKIICGRYTTCNGRLGDIVATLVGLSENRWQHIFITPLFVLALPIAVHRLVSPSCQSICSLRGAGFILFFTALFTVSVSLSPWRSFWCYAAAVNYTWPLPIICSFFALFRTDIYHVSNKWAACFIGGVLGMYSAWSFECITLFLLPGVSLWILIHLLRKKYIPLRCAAGYIGVIFGAFLLVATPALKRRAAADAESRAFNPDSYDWAQMWEFVTNQTPENMELLRASTVSYLLDGIPLPLHVFYAPKLLSMFASCCWVAICVLFILMLMHVMTNREHCKDMLVMGTGLMLSAIVVACSYLYACIPLTTSLLPPVLIVMVGCAYLYTRLSCRIGWALRSVILLGVVGVSLFRLTPSVIEAAQYKKYEKKRLEELHAQIDKGEKYIVLKPSYTSSPQDRLGLIGCMDLCANPSSYPNHIAAMSYGVKSIVITPINPSN